VCSVLDDSPATRCFWDQTACFSACDQQTVPFANKRTKARKSACPKPSWDTATSVEDALAARRTAAAKAKAREACKRAEIAQRQELIVTGPRRVTVPKRYQDVSSYNNPCKCLSKLGSPWPLLMFIANQVTLTCLTLSVALVVECSVTPESALLLNIVLGFVYNRFCDGVVYLQK